MNPRMKHPAALVPGALDALYALGVATRGCGLPPRLIGLVQLRASQINGCVVTMDSHPKLLLASGEVQERLDAVAGWRATGLFTPAERSALALTEEVTRLAGTDDPVPDEVWAEATRHYDQVNLAGLLLAISTITLWNQLNVATRQVAGVWE